MKRVAGCLSAGRFFLSLFFAITVYARADVGLIVETPTGFLGFLSDVGHSSVWISHGCLSEEGEVQFCEHSAGIVLTSTAYWPNPGAAAIPAELFFLGSRPGSAGRSSAAWNQVLAAAYPDVDPRFGRKYMGRVWRRGMRITAFTTSADEDRRVLTEVEQQRRDYHYSYSHRNCAFYAEQVLKLYLGKAFHSNRIFDLGVETPRALERALKHHLRTKADLDFRVLTFKGTLSQSWRQPPRSFCEAAVFDPKYAIPLLLFQPHIYLTFGACYGVIRLSEVAWKKPHRSRNGAADFEPASWADGSVPPSDPRLITYESLTGTLPSGALWIPFSTPAAVHSPPEEAVTPHTSPAF